MPLKWMRERQKKNKELTGEKLTKSERSERKREGDSGRTKII